MPREEALAPDRADRPRRLRRGRGLRELIAPPGLDRRHLIFPVFVAPGRGAPVALEAMPGQFRYPAERIPALARELRSEGVGGVLLFGLPRRKDPAGSEAASPRSAVADAVRAFRKEAPEIVVATDVCLCAYTSHGHCGVLRGREIDNDRSLPRLGQVAVAHARAGAQLVGPSAMMDHQVAEVRSALDRAGYAEVGILAYAIKLASAFYGPFREAEASAPSFGDRASYQLDPRRAGEALRAIDRDAREGADLLLVKPALPALDLLARARARTTLPLGAYQVSGEYALIKSAAARGWIDERAVVRETLTAMRRAGADFVVSYFARDLARAEGAAP